MFIVFEGVDGSGKTTISNQVAERLRGGGLSVTHLRAEGKFASVVSESIRELGRDARNSGLVPQAEFLLYVARDVQLIEEVLRPALLSSDVIIADRFLYTPQVLGHHGRHLAPAWMTPVLRAAAAGIEPDLVVLVDVDPVLARARRKSAKLAAGDARPPARKGLAGVGLQQRLRRGYLELAAASPDRWTVVENDDAPLDQLVAQVTALIQEARTAGVPPTLQRLRAREAARARPPVPDVPTPRHALDALLRWIDQRAQREPRVAAYLLSDLAGPGVDERRRALATRVPDAILAGLVGLDDPTSWELREALKESRPRAVAMTLSGLSELDARAAGMRQALETLAPAEVAASLTGLTEDRAWALRERLFASAPDAVVGSLARVTLPRAWTLRQRWLQAREDLLTSHYEAARVAARSVTGCDDEAAWRVRDRARSLAPVAALASIEGLRSPRAWAWREEYLTRAPKVVMSTLRAVRDPEAWTMRNAVAADCKEALDSVVALDDPEAWELREGHADRWPSTVVKSLGPLASTPRGQALVKRQLAAYPQNVSLLKHVAAIALGAFLFVVAGAVTGCGAGEPGAANDGGVGDAGTGALLPWKPGYSWTYRVTDGSGMGTKITTIGDQEPVGGTGLNKDRSAFKVVTKKGTGADQTISWQAEVDGKVVRYREQSFSATNGMLELEEHWDPYKLHVDGTAMNTAAAATWLESYRETKQVPGGQAVTSEQRDRWTVTSTSQQVTVPAGTFTAIVLQKVGGTSSKTYWYVRGVGKVKETGGQLEELMSFQVTP